MDVGTRLQTIRKPKSPSQREPVKRAGVTNSTISMIEKNSVSLSISSLEKVLDGIPMPLMEFFSLDLEQDSRTQAVYKVDELINISSSAVSIRLVGEAHPSRAIVFLDEAYPPGSDTGEEVLSHGGEEAGVLVDGRLELTVNSEIYVLERNGSYYFKNNKPHRFHNPYDVPARLVGAAVLANF